MLVPDVNSNIAHKTLKEKNVGHDTRIFTAVRDGLQKYCDLSNARSIVKQMWILKNS